MILFKIGRTRAGALSFFLFFSSPSFSTISQDSEGRRTVKGAFSVLLDKATDLHSAFQQKDLSLITREIDTTQKIIRDLYGKVLKMPHSQQRGHAFRLLKAIEDHLEGVRFQSMSLSHPPEGAGKHKKQLFRNFVELSRVYELSGAEKQAFYCHLDQSAWIQSGSRPLNPINPRYKNCGRRIW